jgi:hypothetical protein
LKPPEHLRLLLTKTTACRCSMLVILLFIFLGLLACGSKKETAVEAEEEALSRTEFTERIENFFEYSPLRAGKQSEFLIHLTDLSDGTPVEKAEVTLTIRTKNGAEVGNTKARIGKVTGIYVADLTIANRGDYDIEFHVKSAKLDERLPLHDFQVE